MERDSMREFMREGERERKRERENARREKRERERERRDIHIPTRRKRVSDDVMMKAVKRAQKRRGKKAKR